MVRTAIVFVIILVGLVAGARAADSSPLKSTIPGPSSESDPEVLRQGGDTMDDAFVFYLDDGVPVLHACNDDYWFDDVCGEYVARIPDMPAAAGVTYYIVVKGFWHTLESYQISVTQYEPVATETRDWSDVKALFR